MTYIVTFDETSSQGQVAMVIYEWKDVKYLGVTTSVSDDSLPVSDPLITHPALLSNNLRSRRPTYAQQMQSEIAAALLKTWGNLSSRLMTAPPLNKRASGLPVLLLTKALVYDFDDFIVSDIPPSTYRRRNCLAPAFNHGGAIAEVRRHLIIRFCVCEKVLLQCSTNPETFAVQCLVSLTPHGGGEG